MPRPHRFLDAVDLVATAVSYWIPYPRSRGRSAEERRLMALTWLVVVAGLVALVLGAWLTGSIPPGRSTAPQPVAPAP